MIQSNEKMERYYNTLLGFPDEEMEEFWAAVKRELPNSFRFCGSKGYERSRAIDAQLRAHSLTLFIFCRHALAVKRLLQSRYIPEIVKITNEDGQFVDPPQPVPWYPDNLAWWMTTPKTVVRKFPPFAAFQKFLVSETTVGNISRQEVVSMIPPLLMDCRPGMTVLDLCAAPGSKAAQLLEMIHRGEEARMRKFQRAFTDEGNGQAVEDTAEVEEDGEAAKLDADPGDDGRATGMLIANDMDYKRSHLLIHQLKRLSSPNIIVTNNDATMYPLIRIPDSENPGKNKLLKFDRILADVPCSGDGTLRKNVNVWKEWSPNNALGLHIAQVRILVRALQMLKVGGRVVYSTCSMNPVENEAVVAAAIDRCRGPDCVEIVDCSAQLPLLKRKDGLKKWKVMDKSSRIWDSWKEVEDHVASIEDGVIPSKLTPSMFPPADGECADLPLERCMRVYSHMQDTGGFFITVLEKKAEFKCKPEKPGSDDANASSASKRPREKSDVEGDDAKRPKVSDVEDEAEAQTSGAANEAEAKDEAEPKTEPEPEVAAPEAAIPTSGADADAAAAAAAADGSAPTSNAQTPAQQQQQLPERKRKQTGPFEEPFIYLAADNPVIQDVSKFYSVSPRFPTDRYLVRNGAGEPAKSIYYTSSLVRDILTHNEGRGIKFVHGGVKMFVKQDAPSAEVCRWRIQSEGMPILQAYVGPDRVVVLRKKETFRRLLVEMFPKIADGLWANLDEIGERVRDIPMGCLVLRVEPDGSDPDFNEHMALPLWKSFQSLNLMLPKEDRSAMLLRIFNDTTPLIHLNLNGQKQQQQQQKEQRNGEQAAKETEGGEAEAGQGEENAAADNADGGDGAAAIDAMDAMDASSGED